MPTTAQPATRDNVSANLLADIGDTVSDWVVQEFPVLKADGFIDGNKAWQVIYCADIGRAGLVFVGSGSSGDTLWTTASSCEDAYLRLVTDTLEP